MSVPKSSKFLCLTADWSIPHVVLTESAPYLPEGTVKITRIITCILLVLSTFYDHVIVPNDYTRHFFMLTNWTWYTICIYFGCITWLNFKLPQKSGTKLTNIEDTGSGPTSTSAAAQNNSDDWSFLMKFAIILYPVIVCAAIVVTILYWALDYSPETVDFNSIIYHAFNSVFVLVEVFCNNIPVFSLFVLATYCFALLYAVSNFTFVMATGRVLYGFLSWKTIFSYILVAVVFVAFSIVFGALYTFSKFKQSKSLSTVIKREENTPSAAETT